MKPKVKTEEDHYAADGVVPDILPGRSRMGLTELRTKSMHLMLIILLAQCVAPNQGRFWTSVHYCWLVATVGVFYVLLC